MSLTTNAGEHCTWDLNDQVVLLHSRSLSMPLICSFVFYSVFALWLLIDSAFTALLLVRSVWRILTCSFRRVLVFLMLTVVCALCLHEAAMDILARGLLLFWVSRLLPLRWFLVPWALHVLLFGISRVLPLLSFWRLPASPGPIQHRTRP